MPTRGPNSANTIVSDPTAGDVAWSNPSYASGSDENRATAALSATEHSEYLRATDFGYDLRRWHTPLGIQVDVQVSKTGAGGVGDVVADLLKAGSLIAQNKATLASLPAVEAYWEYGGAADLWNTPWLSDELNASNHGFVFQCECGAPDSATPRVNDIRGTISYISHGGPYRSSRRGPCPRGQER